MSSSFESFTIFNSEILLSLFLLSFLSFAVLLSSSNRYASISLNPSGVIFTQIALFLIVISLFDTGGIAYITPHDVMSFGPYTFFFQISLLIVAIFSLAVSKDFLNVRSVYMYEYTLLIIFSVIGLSLLCSSSNLITIFMAIELQSLAFYLLAAFQWNSEFSSEAGMKYFVLGSFSSCLLLFGFAMIYLATGSFSFDSIQNLALEPTYFSALSLGLFFSLVALLFKVGAVPFHMWLCDVYEGSLTSVTLFFAIVPKLILFYLIFKITSIVFNSYESLWSSFFLFTGIASIAIASIAALFQKKIKRLFAFSAISHTGFILLALACGSLQSIKAFSFYLVFYIIMTIATFSIILVTANRQGFLLYIVNWSYFSKRNFVLAITLSLVLFSIAGIPPLTGFYSKLLVFLSLVSTQHLFTMVLMALLSCIGCFYYIRLIKIFFFCNNKSGYWVHSSNRALEICIGLSSLTLTLFLLHPDLALLTSSLLTFSFLY